MFDSTDIILIVVCFAVSFVSPSLGTSCGVNFAVMATLLPPASVVPLHGLIEGISSAVRWSLMREYVNYKFVLAFTLGGVVGIVGGWPLIGRFSDDDLRLILGSFFLLTVWVPLAWMRLAPTVGGVSTSFLSVLVGATGPLVAALIARREQDHRVVIGTQGACTVFQHWGKVILFAVSGFSFTNYVDLIIVLTLVTIVGTWLGKKILLKLPQRLLRLALKAVVSVLGLQLLLKGLGIELSNVAIGSLTGASVTLAVIFLGSYVAYQLGAHRSQTPLAKSVQTRTDIPTQSTHASLPGDVDISGLERHIPQLKKSPQSSQSDSIYVRFLMMVAPHTYEVRDRSNPTVEVVKQLTASGYVVVNHKTRYDPDRDRYVVKIYALYAVD